MTSHHAEAAAISQIPLCIAPGTATLHEVIEFAAFANQNMPYIANGIAANLRQSGIEVKVALGGVGWVISAGSKIASARIEALSLAPESATLNLRFELPLQDLAAMTDATVKLFANWQGIHGLIAHKPFLSSLALTLHLDYQP
jgi:hypothetical protein